MSRCPRVAIVLVNWFGGPDTVACLESLAVQSHTNWVAVVVDNGSSDGSLNQIESAMRRLAGEAGEKYLILGIEEARSGDGALAKDLRYLLIQAGSNLGFAAGNNLGISWALDGQFDYVWILNNDTEVHEDALSALLQRMQGTAASVAGSVLVFHDDRTRVQCVGGVKYNLLLARGFQIGEGSVWGGSKVVTEPGELTYVAGASMLISTDVIRKVGGMEERYFLYFEELDWMERLRSYGPAVVATESVVYHKEGASIGTASRTVRSRKSQYYMARNLVLFYRWHHPLLLPVALLRNFREMVRFAAGGHWPHVLVSLQALWEGLCGRTGFRAGL